MYIMCIYNVSVYIVYIHNISNPGVYFSASFNSHLACLARRQVDKLQKVHPSMDINLVK